jgi:hypothetical protein
MPSRSGRAREHVALLVETVKRHRSGERRIV